MENKSTFEPTLLKKSITQKSVTFFDDRIMNKENPSTNTENCKKPLHQIQTPFHQVTAQTNNSSHTSSSHIEHHEHVIDLRKPKPPLANLSLHKKKTSLHVHTNSLNLDSIRKNETIKKLLTCKEKKSVALGLEHDDRSNLRVMEQINQKHTISSAIHSDENSL